MQTMIEYLLAHGIDFCVTGHAVRVRIEGEFKVAHNMTELKALLEG